MCGIFGLAVAAGHGLERAEWDHAVRRLFLLSESRGKEAAGIAVATAEKIVVHKDSVSASEMLKTKDYGRAVANALNGHFGGAKPGGDDRDFVAAIGHCRLVTNGLQGIDANNQPVRRDDAVIIHNGIVVNVDDIWARQNAIRPRADVDTEVIAALVEKSRQGGADVREAIRRAFAEIYGETSIAMLFRDLEVMALATNTGSLFVATAPSGKAMFFASEKEICRKLAADDARAAAFKGAEIRQVEAGDGLILDLATLKSERFALAGAAPQPRAPQIAPRLAANRSIEDKAERIAMARRNMRRCAKCVLPETMPFIAFDESGVCNYCRTHRPWTRRPESELAEMFDKIRSRDGSPDCIVAFSGGRDSSYGLHLLKNKYRMQPLTFSYDWGMVTDLARRNQARLCGKLGIEHIWISADIKTKRAHIRRNVLAWLKKPDLGLVPLFMAGDKEVLWHANSLMKSYGLDHMVFCTNAYEKTVFKQGFLGIDARETTIHKPASLSLGSKADMLWQYARRFAGNPAYFNPSMADTLFAFFSYYVIKQNYFSLFDYVRWDEQEINDTLIGEYDWELAKDTRSTWRIGDGTAPFYNYIYYAVAGLTEYDTFRSYQVRDGELTRARALELIEEENQPRFDSIREYCQLINIDFDETIRVIDRIPKLYLDDGATAAAA